MTSDLLSGPHGFFIALPYKPVASKIHLAWVYPQVRLLTLLRLKGWNTWLRQGITEGYDFHYNNQSDRVQKWRSWSKDRVFSLHRWGKCYTNKVLFLLTYSLWVFRLHVSQRWVSYSWPWVWHSSGLTGSVEKNEVSVAIKEQSSGDQERFNLPQKGSWLH